MEETQCSLYKANAYWRHWCQQGSLLQRWRLKTLEASQTALERMSWCAVELAYLASGFSPCIILLETSEWRHFSLQYLWDIFHIPFYNLKTPQHADKWKKRLGNLILFLDIVFHWFWEYSLNFGNIHLTFFTCGRSTDRESRSMQSQRWNAGALTSQESIVG